jgi:ribonuclease HII
MMSDSGRNKVPDFKFERKLGGRVAGIDEAGRGPLAGPVVAAAVVFSDTTMPKALAGLLDDSKKLTEARRDKAFEELFVQRHVGTLAFGIGAASVREIDTVNILRATHLAMRRALAHLHFLPDAALIDGNQLPRDWPCRAAGLVGGDGKSLSIAAASILAKVVRDKIMKRLAVRYPGYGWDTNKGYGAAAHIESIVALGPTPHHRLSFAPLAQGQLSL